MAVTIVFKLYAGNNVGGTIAATAVISIFTKNFPINLDYEFINPLPGQDIYSKFPDPSADIVLIVFMLTKIRIGELIEHIIFPAADNLERPIEIAQYRADHIIAH